MRVLRLFIAPLCFVACGEKAPATADTQASANVQPPPAAAPATGGDTLRGVIGVRGRDTLPELELQMGPDTIALRSTDIETLRRVIGFEVTVRGSRVAAHFDVASFVVQSLNGERVTEGTLDVEQGVFFVRTAAGERVNVPRLPGPLRGEIGSRVYLVGPLDRLSSAFGVITERR